MFIPVKYYKDEGFVERKIESTKKTLSGSSKNTSAITRILTDEIEIVNNRPMNIWLYAKCRRYIDPDLPEAEQIADAEVQISGKYDGNPTGR
jgi:hypothetical protein